MYKQIVAVALLTSEELALLGSSFTRAYPVNDTPCYGALLAAIDEADRELWRRRDATSNADEPRLMIAVSA
ncbi:MAG: hypothetical protein ABIO85_10100 [Sphingomicrobium sp.]